MRVLGVLVAWGVLAVLATMCFALGGSLGYRRGVRDTLAQIRDRRTGKTGCRPLPANHLRRRTSGHARPGARARRARWHVGPGSARTPHARRYAARKGRVPTVAAASVAVLLLIGIPGTAIGATTAQPGESLWKVKLGLERVRLALATTPERDTEVHVDLARVRLTELEGLVKSDPAPSVVGDVSKDLGDHALAASGGLQHVDPPARTELQERILDLTRVMDSMLEDDCTRDADLACESLEQTRDEMVALQDPDVTIAGAAGTEVASAPSSPPVQAEPLPPGPADTDTQPASEATTGGTAAAGDDPVAAQPDTAPAASSTPSSSPSVSASASATPAPTPSPSPTASPTPPPAGSPATETAVEPSADKAAGGVSPKVDAGATAADTRTD